MEQAIRRIRTRSAVAAGVVAMSLIAVACSSGSKTPAGATGTPTSGKSANGTPATDPNGFLRIAAAGPVSTLDPHKATGSNYPTWIYPVYDRLFQIDVDSKVQPMLAKSYEFSSDGTTLTLHLRDDVKFHDGSPVVAAAVKASLERAKTLKGSSVATLLTGVVAADVVDDHTVKLTLHGIGADVTSLLASNAGAVLNPKVLADPSVDLDKAPPAGAASGPYVVTKSEPNAATTYARAPEYWDHSAGLMKGFTLTFAISATRLSGLKAGDFDLAQITPDTFDEASSAVKAGQLSMVTHPAATHDLMFNVTNGDLADPNVRKAIALAINRQDIGRLYTCLDNTQPQRQGHWAYNPDIKNTYDPAQAAQLIKARGGAAFEISYAAGGSTEPLVTVLQSQLAKVGIKVTLRGVQQVVVLEQLGTGQAQSIVSTMTPGADPVEALNRFFLAGTHIARGPLGDQLRALADPGSNPNLSQDQRAAIYKQAFKFIADNYMYVPVCQTVQGWASSKHVVGVDKMPGIDRGIPVLTSIGVTAS